VAQLTFPLTKAGLSVPVWVGVSGSASAALLSAGQPIPAPVQAQGLVDTGTDATAVAAGLLQRLALSPVRSTTSHTTGGPVRVRLFKVSLSITDPGQPSAPWFTEPDLLVMELPTVLPDADVLIGLDILLTLRLHLDGPARRFTLDF
jgi:hypothetical protein